MASAIIHMAVASELNKKLNRDENKLLIGSIAPDISKHVGETKKLSHFLSDDTDIPNIDKFLVKYKSRLDDDFVLGYFIHLYTDYLWFKYFVPEFYNNDTATITKIDGSTFKCSGKMFNLYIYNDYTNMNEKLLDEYNMNLSIFYSEPPIFEHIIEEIPMDKIKIIIDKMSIIIKNSKVQKDFVFDIDNVKQFIDMSIELISAKLSELKIA